METPKGKTGYLSATTDETEEALIERLVALQGVGRATVVKLILRKYGPVEVADLEKKLGIPANANPSGEDTKDSKQDAASQG